MSRRVFREILALSVPVALIGLFGFYVSGRSWSNGPLPAPHGPALKFTAKAPSTLQAFDGIDMVAAVELVPPSPGGVAALTPMPKPELWSGNGWDVAPYLEIHVPEGTSKTNERVVTTHYNSHGSERWNEVWQGNTNNSDYALRLDSIPNSHTLEFGCTVKHQNPASTAAPVMGSWKIDRATLKRFDFAHTPRVPLVTLVSARVTAKSLADIKGEILFRLDDPKISDSTSLGVDLDTHYGGGWGVDNIPNRARFRICKWSFTPPSRFKAKAMTRISGHASADEQWPLAFTIEPFDDTTVKIGQKLKFTTKVADIPKPQSD